MNSQKKWNLTLSTFHDKGEQLNTPVRCDSCLTEFDALLDVDWYKYERGMPTSTIVECPECPAKFEYTVRSA